MVIVCLVDGQRGDILEFYLSDKMQGEKVTLEKINDDFSTKITDIKLLLEDKIVGAVYLGRDENE